MVSGCVSEYSPGSTSAAASGTSRTGSEITTGRDSTLAENAGVTSSSSSANGSVTSATGSASSSASGAANWRSETVSSANAVASGSASAAEKSTTGSAASRTGICSCVWGWSSSWWIAARGSSSSDSAGWTESYASSGSGSRTTAGRAITGTGRRFSTIAPGAMKTHLSWVSAIPLALANASSDAHSSTVISRSAGSAGNSSGQFVSTSKPPARKSFARGSGASPHPAKNPSTGQWGLFSGSANNYKEL